MTKNVTNCILCDYDDSKISTIPSIKKKKNLAKIRKKENKTNLK